MMGWTSLKFAFASSVGDLMRGSSLLKTRNVVVGWLRAAERNLWSVRRKETRLRGEPLASVRC